MFPGIGFAAILGRCRRISDAMIIESAFALADYTERHYLSRERIFRRSTTRRSASESRPRSWRWHYGRLGRVGRTWMARILRRWVTT